MYYQYLFQIYFEDDDKPKMSIADICNSLSEIQKKFDIYPIYFRGVNFYYNLEEWLELSEQTIRRQ